MNESQCPFFLNGWFSVRLRILSSTWHWEEPFSFGKLKIPSDNILLFAHVCAFSVLPVLGPACNQIQPAEVAVWGPVQQRPVPTLRLLGEALYQREVCQARASLSSNFSPPGRRPTLWNHKFDCVFSTWKDNLAHNFAVKKLKSLFELGWAVWGISHLYPHAAFSVTWPRCECVRTGTIWPGVGGGGLVDLSHEECCL